MDKFISIHNLSSLPPEQTSPKKRAKDNDQNALITAFFTLLDAVNESVQSAQVMAKELKANESAMDSIECQNSKLVMSQVAKTKTRVIKYPDGHVSIFTTPQPEPTFYYQQIADKNQLISKEREFFTNTLNALEQKAQTQQSYMGVNADTVAQFIKAGGAILSQLGALTKQLCQMNLAQT